MRAGSLRVFWALLLVASVAGSEAVDANSIFTVTLDTSPLVGSPSAPFAAAFQLVDGSGLADNNNSATLTSFAFGGGSASGCPLNCVTTGDASGDMTGTVVLKDSDFFNSFAERFTVGTSLSFVVELTTNVDAGGTPDTFAFSLLDSTGTPLPTDDPSFGDTLLSVFIDSGSPPVFTFGSQTFDVRAPALGTPTAPVPEPGTLVVLATGVVGLAAMAARARKGAR